MENKGKDKCGRCGGKGAIVAFSHIVNGVCFACWGCGLDLRSERRAIEAVLTGLRQDWLAVARREGKKSDKLPPIVERGTKAAAALRKFDLDVRVLAEAAKKHA
jgi:hypothetical protein